MTNAEQILNAINEWKNAAQSYGAAPSTEGWRVVNSLHNELIPTAKRLPLTRAEYESLLGGQNLRDDDAIYRCQSSWWNGDSEILWCLAHYARQAGLVAERGQYVAPTAAMLGLELVTDGLPSGFREYHRGAQC